MTEPTFDYVEHGNWVVLHVRGEIDMATAPQMRNRVQVIVARQPQGLVLDLGGVDFIDSTGLGVIVGAAKRMRINDGELRIVCDQPHLNELFELTRLNRVFDFFPTVTAALADAGRSQESRHPGSDDPPFHDPLRTGDST